jgi:hypothetical protein
MRWNRKNLGGLRNQDPPASAPPNLPGGIADQGVPDAILRVQSLLRELGVPPSTRHDQPCWTRRVAG